MQYLSIGRWLLRERGPQAKHIGRRIVYDRHDLDRWADIVSGQPLDQRSEEAATKEVERRFFEEQARKAAR